MDRRACLVWSSLTITPRNNLRFATTFYRVLIGIVFQALPDLDANANAVVIQTLVLENEGWERDYDIPEPAEPGFDVPPA